MAEIYWPVGIAIDRTGNIYFGDGNPVVRKINLAGIITTVAGNGTIGYSGDGGQATNAQLYGPTGIAIDNAGNVYIADFNDQVIRKVDTFGIISTIVGNGTPGFGGDNGQATAAQLNYPKGVCIDKLNNLYIADCVNNRIRKINNSGIISTIAGNGSAAFYGDGGLASAAQLNQPYDVIVDDSENIYISDASNGRIRKINNMGIINTIAGSSTFGFSGDGGPATAALLDGPDGMAFDSIGNLYFVDLQNYRIRCISTSGIITTIAGNGIFGYFGDGGNPKLAEFNTLGRIVIDYKNRIYIADWGNNRIRQISYNVEVNTLIKERFEVQLLPNPSSGHFTIKTTSGSLSIFNVIISDIFGRHIKDFQIKSDEIVDIDLDIADGIYMLSAETTQQKIVKKIIIMH